jgi:heat shock protein 4
MSVNKGAIGLDFGSSRTVVAVAKNKGVDVLINEASNR